MSRHNDCIMILIWHQLCAKEYAWSLSHIYFLILSILENNIKGPTKLKSIVYFKVLYDIIVIQILTFAQIWARVGLCLVLGSGVSRQNQHVMIFVSDHALRLTLVYVYAVYLKLIFLLLNACDFQSMLCKQYKCTKALTLPATLVEAIVRNNDSIIMGHQV